MDEKTKAIVNLLYPLIINHGLAGKSNVWKVCRGFCQQETSIAGLQIFQLAAFDDTWGYAYLGIQLEDLSYQIVGTDF